MTNGAFWIPPEPERFDILAAHREESTLGRWCHVSHEFVEWCKLLLADTIANPSYQSVSQAHFDLHKKYRQFRITAPSGHRDITRGHWCLYQAYIAAGDQLDELERKLAPPRLITAPTPVQRAIEQPAEPIGYSDDIFMGKTAG